MKHTLPSILPVCSVLTSVDLSAQGTHRIASAGAGLMKSSGSRFAKLMSIGMFGFILLSVALWVSPAYALPIAGDPPEKALECLGGLQGTISAQPVPLWGTATLRWNVTVPSSCTNLGLKLYVDSLVVSPTGSRSIIKLFADTSYRLNARLPAVFGGGRRDLATNTIKVNLPPVVTIKENGLERLLVQALWTKGTYIYVENHVKLNLSRREYIPIAADVTLAGGRTARQPGPLLYTTIRPYRELFSIHGDDVRITGVRIEGPDRFGVVRAEDEPNSGIGIKVLPFVRIKIDHNEIYGWNNSAVLVEDCDGKEEKDRCPSPGRMAPSENPFAVRIHDNYIHHNQHQGGNGYGVVMKDGAYALIDRNVFDWNRHAIAAAGSPGTGYAAYRNLVLENGGYHDSYNHCDLLDKLPGYLRVPLALASPSWALAEVSCKIPGNHVAYDFYTHQFDMHGTRSCDGGHYNCGDAGHSMYIRYNSFLYTRGDAIKLRGTPLGMRESPQLGMFVTSNVFAHALLKPPGVAFDLLADPLYETAIEQKETGLIYSNNLLKVNGMNELGTCDFDGDGTPDSFLATGQTWWYSSGGDKPWVYLNTSTKRRAEVTLGFFNADNICDVKVDGIIYPGGKTPLGGGVLQ